jgi:hypothetical protein
MKIILLLLFSFPVLASDFCDSNTKIYGEASSFDKINNKIQKVTEKYFLPSKISEHLGAFENIVITSDKKLKAILILGKEIPLKIEDGNYRTVGFNLFKTLEAQNIMGDFFIEVIGVEKFQCTKKYKVIVSE